MSRIATVWSAIRRPSVRICSSSVIVVAPVIPATVSTVGSPIVVVVTITVGPVPVLVLIPTVIIAARVPSAPLRATVVIPVAHSSGSEHVPYAGCNSLKSSLKVPILVTLNATSNLIFIAENTLC